MNEGDEVIVSSATRKKKRRSGFRFSSKKVLQRSRVKKETSRVGGIQFESITKALSFLCEIGEINHQDYAPGLRLPSCL